MQQYSTLAGNVVEIAEIRCSKVLNSICHNRIGRLRHVFVEPASKSVKIRATLNLPEAFFLVQELKCLQVSCSGDESCCMSESECWIAFCRAERNFAALYTVFRHFRRIGWIVTPGVRYGVDFLLYQRHPSIVHASYGILVQFQSPKMSWPDVQGLARTMSDVGKQLLVCSAAFTMTGNVAGPSDASINSYLPVCVLDHVNVCVMRMLSVPLDGAKDRNMQGHETPRCLAVRKRQRLLTDSMSSMSSCPLPHLGEDCNVRSSQKNMMVIVSVGLPRSGKSTLASVLQLRGWVTASGDILRCMERESSHSQDLIRPRKLIIDCCNATAQQRQNLIKLFRHHCQRNYSTEYQNENKQCPSGISLVAVWVDASVLVCQQRITPRHLNPTELALHEDARMIVDTAQSFQAPTTSEGFDHVIKINNNNDSLAAVTSLLLEISALECKAADVDVEGSTAFSI